MTPRLALSLLCVTAATMTSCKSTGSEDQRSDGTVIVVPYDGIPRSAESYATGVGLLEWTADRDGRMWVGDDQQKRLLVNRPVRQSDLIVVDVPNNQIKLNDTVIYDRKLDPEHQHSVFIR